MKTKMQYDEAKRLADQVIEVLRPGCERIEIAGSLRRKKPEIGDIELVAIPRMEVQLDLFGQASGYHSLLNDIISANYRVVFGKDKFKQLDLGQITCDLFIQPDPRTWGVNFTIRTGSSEFSHWLVTPRRKGGALPGYMYVAEAQLWDGTNLIETPEEQDFFRAIGLRWIEPENRMMGFWGQSMKFALQEA